MPRHPVQSFRITRPFIGPQQDPTLTIHFGDPASPTRATSVIPPEVAGLLVKSGDVCCVVEYDPGTKQLHLAFDCAAASDAQVTPAK